MICECGPSPVKVEATFVILPCGDVVGDEIHSVKCEWCHRQKVLSAFWEVTLMHQIVEIRQEQLNRGH